jgi:hypothetical protein
LMIQRCIWNGNVVAFAKTRSGQRFGAPVHTTVFRRFLSCLSGYSREIAEALTAYEQDDHGGDDHSDHELVAAVRKTPLFSQLFLCLSRACPGKMIVHTYV